MTTTAIPSSSASGSRRSSASCSRGLSGSWTTSKRPRPQRPLELVERAGAPVRDADAVDAPRRALLLEPAQVLLPGDEVVHLLDLDAPEEAALLSYCARPSSTLGVQIFVATVVSSRRDRRAQRRATPAHGRTSATSRRRRHPQPSAASTTARARATSPSNVRYVPSPTTGPSRRRSISVTLAQRGSDSGGRQGARHVHIRRVRS